MSVRCLTFFVLLLTSLLTTPAWAHKPSDSYMTLDASGPTLAGRWDIALRDLEFAVGLDANQDSDITWGEVKAQEQAIAAYALSRLDLSADDATVTFGLAALQVDDHSDGAYAVLRLTSDTPGNAEPLRVTYRLLFDRDPTHRGLVRYRDAAGGERSVVLSPDTPWVVLAAGDGGRWRALIDYIREGVWHIWIGFDHVLFLISLLLPAVLVRRRRSGADGDGGSSTPHWEPVASFRAALKSVLGLVTMFTLAHSLTLWLATMEWVVLPIRPVEAVIALSIVVTAAHNLWPRLPLPGPAVAFGFGLIHGFGFRQCVGRPGAECGYVRCGAAGFQRGRGTRPVGDRGGVPAGRLPAAPHRVLPGVCAVRRLGGDRGAGGHLVCGACVQPGTHRNLSAAEARNGPGCPLECRASVEGERSFSPAVGRWGGSIQERAWTERFRVAWPRAAVDDRAGV